MRLCLTDRVCGLWSVVCCLIIQFANFLFMSWARTVHQSYQAHWYDMCDVWLLNPTLSSLHASCSCLQFSRWLKQGLTHVFIKHETWEACYLLFYILACEIDCLSDSLETNSNSQVMQGNCHVSCSVYHRHRIAYLNALARQEDNSAHHCPPTLPSNLPGRYHIDWVLVVVLGSGSGLIWTKRTFKNFKWRLNPNKFG